MKLLAPDANFKTTMKVFCTLLVKKPQALGLLSDRIRTHDARMQQETEALNTSMHRYPKLFKKTSVSCAKMFQGSIFPNSTLHYQENDT